MAVISLTVQMTGSAGLDKRWLRMVAALQQNLARVMPACHAAPILTTRRTSAGQKCFT